METPTPTDVRKRSELLRTLYPDPSGDELLKVILDDDAPVISSLTGRAIGPPSQPGEEVPEHLRPVAIRVFALRAEKTSLQGVAETREEVIANGNIRSESYGPVSFSYFGPGEASVAKTLDPDPAVHELLWTLATDAKRLYWEELWGMRPPAPFSRVVSFDYGIRQQSRRGY